MESLIEVELLQIFTVCLYGINIKWNTLSNIYMQEALRYQAPIKQQQLHAKIHVSQQQSN